LETLHYIGVSVRIISGAPMSWHGLFLHSSND
jgi:hypothetical protein